MISFHMLNDTLYALTVHRLLYFDIFFRRKAMQRFVEDKNNIFFANGYPFNKD